MKGLVSKSNEAGFEWLIKRRQKLKGVTDCDSGKKTTFKGDLGLHLHPFRINAQRRRQARTHSEPQMSLLFMHGFWQRRHCVHFKHPEAPFLVLLFVSEAELYDESSEARRSAFPGFSSDSDCPN